MSHCGTLVNIEHAGETGTVRAIDAAHQKPLRAFTAMTRLPTGGRAGIRRPLGAEPQDI